MTGASEAGGAIWRLDSGGQLDATFGDGGYKLFSSDDGHFTRFTAVHEAADGAFYAGGATTNNGGLGLTFPTFAKMTPRGELDASYGVNGVSVDERATPFILTGAPSVMFLPRHRAVLLGKDPDLRLVVVRRYWY